MGLQQLGTERRGQRQGNDGRQHHGYGNGQGELFVQLAGRTAHKRDWYKYCGQHAGNGHYRARYFFHGPIGCFLRGKARFLNVMFNGLYHDDGVIDYQTDGQDHGKHGQGIDGKSQQYEGAEGADQGNRNRQHGDQGGPHIAQKNINYDQYQDQGLEEGMGNLFQRFPDELGLIRSNYQFHVRRETGLRIFQHLSDFRYRFNGICIGGQRNRINNGFAAYAFIQKQGRRSIHTFAFINIGDVLQF